MATKKMCFKRWFFWRFSIRAHPHYPRPSAVKISRSGPIENESASQRVIEKLLTERIKQKAVEVGFDVVGIAPARKAPHAAAFKQWIEEGNHGELDWMAREAERRVDPGAVLDGARAVVSVGVSYYVEEPGADIWNDPSRGRIARYAWQHDYHDTIAPMLKELADFIDRESGGGRRTRYYVDTGPVLERESGWQSGLGFIGKNSLLIAPRFGSYIFLGEIITSVDLEYDEPAHDEGASIPIKSEKKGTCGSCRRCTDICPTHAFPAAYILDSRLCTSYLTIELKGSIPEELRPTMKNWIYGCDECQEVCSWVRRYAQPPERRVLEFEAKWMAPPLLELMGMDDARFREFFKGSPVRRTKRRGVLRNVAVALGNWGDPSALPVLECALDDKESLVREHARWALSKIQQTGGR